MGSESAEWRSVTGSDDLLANIEVSDYLVYPGFELSYAVCGHAGTITAKIVTTSYHLNGGRHDVPRQ